MKEFKINTDLDKDALITFIEASAGTGKTYSLAMLYLRMIMEKRYDIQDILAVTFTNAAVDELKTRVRKFLNIALEIIRDWEFIDGDISFLKEGTDDYGEKKDIYGFILKAIDNDTHNGKMLRQAQHDSNSNSNSLLILSLLLKKAKNTLDQAHIFTIHGFCLKILDDFSFSSLSNFDNELVNSDAELILDASEKYYKNHIDTLPENLFSFVMAEKFSVNTINTFAKDNFNKAGIEIVIDEISQNDIESHFIIDKKWEEIKEEWRVSTEEIKLIITDSKDLKRNKDNFKLNVLPELFLEIDNCIKKDEILLTPFYKLSRNNIEKEVKKKYTEIPAHTFFDLCQDFVELLQKLIPTLKKQSFYYIKNEIKKKKEILNVRSFNDLIEDLHFTLMDSESSNSRKKDASFIKSIQNRYKVAFIDEFQDTDLKQWEIFNKIFIEGQKPIYLIGDPKQAIYSFRGADIYTYFNAKNISGANILNLQTNFRSSANFMKAVNQIFIQENSFISNQISYNEIKSGFEESDKKLLKLNNTSSVVKPIVIWEYEGEKNLNNEKIIEKNITNEIILLLTEKYEIDDKKVTPKDIAILTKSHKQSAAIKDMLQRNKIPAVISKSGSIFHSEEAKAVFNFLFAVSLVSDTRYINNFLISRLTNFTENDIYEMTDIEKNTHLVNFKNYNKLWNEKGVMWVLNTMSNDYDLIQKLLQNKNERYLTNFRHISEVLHKEEKTENSNPLKLLNFFAERVNSSDSEENEEYEIRLETDEMAVKILTIHKSKGLEFPIVFSPYFSSNIPGTKTFTSGNYYYHDDDNNIINDLSLLSIEEKKKKAIKELKEENMRVFYVAVTRASARFYTYLPSKIDKNPVALLLETLKNKKHTNNLFDFKKIDNIEYKDFNKFNFSSFDSKSEYKEQKKLPKILTGTTVSSYTGISSHKSLSEFIEDQKKLNNEILNRENRDIVPEYSIINFKKGATVGIALHEIMEKIDYTAFVLEKNNSRLKLKVENILDIYKILPVNNNIINETNDYRVRWIDSIANCVSNILKTNLTNSAGESFSLSNIKNSSRITELQFYLKNNKLNKSILETIISEKINLNEKLFNNNNNSDENNGINGWLNGFIDLVFEQNNKYYILDWKSNYLGPDLMDYNAENIAKNMSESNYHLQYYLYIIALNKYLENKLGKDNYNYEENFGGVYYIYFRGFDNIQNMLDSNDNMNSGIYFNKPAVNEIVKLTEQIIGD